MPVLYTVACSRSYVISMHCTNITYNQRHIELPNYNLFPSMFKDAVINSKPSGRMPVPAPGVIYACGMQITALELSRTEDKQLDTG